MAFAPTKVPDKITPDLIAICKKNVGHEDVRFVDIKSDSKYKVKKCAYNALHEAKEVGGEVVFGWAIYVWEGVFYDFVGHAVVKLNESYYCVTPTQYDDSRIVFISDDKISFNYDDQNSRMPCKEIAISKYKAIKELIVVRDSIRVIKTKYPVTSGQISITIDDMNQLKELDESQNYLMNKAIFHHHPIKNTCPCDSGKQFRKCCRPRMQKEFS